MYINDFYQESIELEISWNNIMLESVTADFKATNNINGIVNKLVDVIKDIANGIVTFILKRINGFTKMIGEMQDMMKRLKMERMNRIPDSFRRKPFANPVSLNFTDNSVLEDFLDKVYSSQEPEQLTVPQVGTHSKSFNSLEKMSDEFVVLNAKLSKIKTKMSTLKGTFKQKTDKYVNISKQHQQNAQNGDKEALEKIRNTKSDLELERARSIKAAMAYNAMLANLRNDMKTLITGFNANMPSKQDLQDAE